MTNLINCGTCGYPLTPEERTTLVEHNGVMVKPEQEPVAWMLEGWGPDCGPYFEIYRNDEMGWRDKKEWTPLYTTPPQRTWVDLTDEQMWNAYTGGSDIINLDYAKSIVALFKELNT